MKIKEIKEKCAEIIKNTPPYDFADEAKKEKEKLCISFSAIEKGVPTEKIWCPHCRKVVDKSSIKTINYMENQCVCGQRIISDFRNCFINMQPLLARILYVDSEFALIEQIGTKRTEWTTSTDLKDPEEFWKSLTFNLPETPSECYYVISREYGLRRMSSETSALAPVKTASARGNFIKNEKLEKDYKWFMETFCGTSKSGYGVSLYTDVCQAFAYTERIKAASPSKSVLSTKKEDETARKMYKEDAMECILGKTKGLSSAYKYSDTEYVYWCKKCGHYEIRECSELEKSKETMFCSCCGTAIDMSQKAASRVVERTRFVDIVSDTNGDLAFNYYCVIMDFDDETSKFISKCEFEGKTVCFTNGKIRDYDENGNRDSNKCFGTYGLISVRDRERELIEIEASKWGRLGLNIVYKKADDDPKRRIGSMIDFIECVKSKPIAEKLIKCNCTKLYDFVKFASSCPEVNLKAPNIRECFGLSKKQTTLVIENNMTFSQMQHLKLLQKADPNCSFEDYNWSFTTYNCSADGTNSVLRAVKETGATVKAVKDYICSCYYDQCIDWPEIVSIWIDYLKMMDQLNFSPAEKKKEMYPSSLKKAHDVLNFAAKNIYDKEKSKVFDENVAEAKKFEYSFGKYLVKAPDSAEDLVKEGIALNHSVGQHIAYVADKSEYILFIREKSVPDKPLYTVELLRIGKEIVQVRGNSNRLVKEPEVLEFIQKWAKYKKLVVKSF